MPFLTLKFNDDRADEVLEVEGEARLIVSVADSFAFGGPGGLVSALLEDDDPRKVEAEAPVEKPAPAKKAAARKPAAKKAAPKASAKKKA